MTRVASLHNVFPSRKLCVMLLLDDDGTVCDLVT